MTTAASESVPDAAPRDAVRERWAVAGTLLAVLLVFLPSLFCGFTLWDDGAFVFWNPDVADPDLFRIFDPANRVVGDWTPLATVTYAAERALLGEAAWVPHATSLVLHLIAVWLVQRLCRDLGFGLWTSVGVALVFGVHALQVESVVWVSARKNVLVAVFTLAFLRSHLAAHPVRASVWLLLALCSKATAVGLPLVAAAAQTLGLGAPRGRASWAWIAMWTVPCVLRAWLSLDAQADIIARTAAVGFAGRMAVMGSVLTTQARQVIFPTDLSVLYDPPRREWSDPVLLGQWALLAAIVAGAAWFVRRDRRLAWLAVFAIAMLAPTINVFPGPAYQADRYLHLPLVGIAALLLAAAGLLARVRPWLPAVVVGAWVGVVLVPLTLFRESHWRDHDTLFAETVRTTPNSALAWSQLGLARRERRDAAGAVEAFLRARSIEPGNPFLGLNLSLAYIDGGRYADAERVVREILAADPRNGEARGVLGVLAARAGRPADAAREFAEALRLAPQSENVRRWVAEFSSLGVRPQ